MKTYKNVSILLTSLFLFSSCELFSGKVDDPQVDSKVEIQKIEVLPDSIKNKMIEQDSLVRNLIAKIDSLTLGLNETQSNVSDIKSNVENLKSPNKLWNFISIVAFIIGVTALVMSIFKSKGLKRLDVENIFSDCMDQSTRIKAMKNQIENLQSSSRGSSSHGNKQQPSDVESRLNSLEVTMKQVVDYINNSTKPNISSQGEPDNHNYDYSYNYNEQPSFVKAGYAKLNRQNYFFDIFESNQEGCVYKIQFKSPTKGEFDLISLDKIKSRNGWQDIIEYEGPCTMAEATSYRLISPGVIEKYDSKTWEVKKKLKINIYK